MRDLVDKFKRFAILEDHLLLVLLLVLLLLPVTLLVVLPTVHLEVGILDVVGQPQQKLGLLLEELKQLEVVLLGVQDGGIGSGLLALVYLLDERVDGLAGLDGHVLVLFDQVRVELVEQRHVVLRRDEVPLEDLEDGDLVLGGMLVFDEGGQEVPYRFLLEGQHLLRAGGHGVLAVLELVEVFLEVVEGLRAERRT